MPPLPPPPPLADTNRKSPSLLCSMAPFKNKGKTRLGGKPSVKAKNRQIRKKKTTRNYPGRFNGAGTASGKATVWGKPSLKNGAGTASFKAKNLEVDKKTTSSQKSKSHDDDDASGKTSRKEAQAGISKQQPHDDIPDVIMNNNNTQHNINEFRCTCPGSDGLSSCPRYRLPRIPTFYDDDDDDYLLDTMAVYH